MNAIHFVDRYLARYPFLAAAGYGVLVLAFIAVGWGALSDLNERRVTRAQLNTGDVLKVGETSLQFRMDQKRGGTEAP